MYRCASALLNVTFHTMRKRKVRQKPLNPTRSALLFLPFSMTCQFTWLAVKIEGPPPNYVLHLQICSHFPKVSYTWTSLFNDLEDLFWWNKSGCCETCSVPVTVIAGNHAACYKISKHCLYLTPMSLQHKEGRTSSGQCTEYVTFSILGFYMRVFTFISGTRGRNRCRPLAFHCRVTIKSFTCICL